MSKLCGSNLPKMYNISGNTLKLTFKSGQQNLNKIGFIATYVSGKGNEIHWIVLSVLNYSPWCPVRANPYCSSVTTGGHYYCSSVTTGENMCCLAESNWNW